MGISLTIALGEAVLMGRKSHVEWTPLERSRVECPWGASWRRLVSGSPPVVPGVLLGVPTISSITPGVPTISITSWRWRENGGCNVPLFIGLEAE